MINSWEFIFKNFSLYAIVPFFMHVSVLVAKQDLVSFLFSSGRDILFVVLANLFESHKKVGKFCIN